MGNAFLIPLRIWGKTVNTPAHKTFMRSKVLDKSSKTASSSSDRLPDRHRAGNYMFIGMLQAPL